MFSFYNIKIVHCPFSELLKIRISKSPCVVPTTVILNMSVCVTLLCIDIVVAFWELLTLFDLEMLCDIYHIFPNLIFLISTFLEILCEQLVFLTYSLVFLLLGEAQIPVCSMYSVGLWPQILYSFCRLLGTYVHSCWLVCYWVVDIRVPSIYLAFFFDIYNFFNVMSNFFFSYIFKW